MAARPAHGRTTRPNPRPARPNPGRSDRGSCPDGRTVIPGYERAVSDASVSEAFISLADTLVDDYDVIDLLH